MIINSISMEKVMITSIEWPNQTKLIGLSISDGTVWTLSTLDFEEKNFYNITVIAYDKGTPSLSSTAKLWVTVADTPDSVPDFSKAVYTVEVAENAKPGDIVYKLDAGDGPFKYYLLSMYQSINRWNWQI